MLVGFALAAAIPAVGAARRLRRRARARPVRGSVWGPRVRRAALEEAERRCTDELLGGRIDSATYRGRMTEIAHRRW